MHFPAFSTSVALPFRFENAWLPPIADVELDANGAAVQHVAGTFACAAGFVDFYSFDPLFIFSPLSFALFTPSFSLSSSPIPLFSPQASGVSSRSSLKKAATWRLFSTT